LIVALGALLGVLATTLGSIFVARVRIKEVEVTYAQRLQDSYLENARNYTTTVYQPLGIELHKLFDGYRQLRISLNFEKQEADPASLEQFRQIMRKYDHAVSSLLDRGASAFLTTTLEQRLEAFNVFLRESVEAKEAVAKQVLMVAGGLLSPFFGMFKALSTTEREVVWSGKALGPLRSLKIRIPLVGFGFGLNMNMETLKAPITSRAFEERIVADVAAIRFLIKEVTLGKHAAPNS